jgi:anti-sigma regulatory factor (Ser/Thr protein kinase)
VRSIALELTSRPAAAGTARSRITGFAVAQGADADLAQRVALAVTEAVVNAVRHAYPSGTGPVECHADVDEGLLEIVIADRGAGFRAEASSPGLGAGLAVIAACCDDFTIAQQRDAGVEIWMRFVMPGDAEA